MSKATRALRWLLPILLLLVHLVWVPGIAAYNLSIGAHWLFYAVLLGYLFLLGDVGALLKKCKQGLLHLRFAVRAVAVFGIAFAILIGILAFFSDSSMPMYRLWVPLQGPAVALWVPLYIIVQPLVDHIIYHKWMIHPRSGPQTRVFILLAATLRTFVETNVLVWVKASQIPDEAILSLALFCVNTVFALAYFCAEDEGFSFSAEVLFRIALVIAVLVGMPQLLPFIG